MFRAPLSPKTMLEYCRIVAGIELNIVLGMGRGRLGKCSFVINIVERANNFVGDCSLKTSVVHVLNDTLHSIPTVQSLFNADHLNSINKLILCCRILQMPAKHFIELQENMPQR